jgi:dTDP-4-amino-4,6-dideoxygalactose transaminase
MASTGKKQTVVPVYRPRLPLASAIAKYLRQLDDSRFYSNRGALTWALESRLEARFGLKQGSLITAASGTAALVAAILATAGRAAAARPCCLCPGYTFVAAPLAAEMCGYRPHLVDIDAGSWAVDPVQLAAHPMIGQAGLALIAAPYGRRYSQSAWSEFVRRTGVPVVIDAAAGIELFADNLDDLAGPVPVVLSFHATKPFATGEGGAIVCLDRRILDNAVASMNFGFVNARQTSMAAFNGKMSEYHAAVGLAELDGWDAKRAAQQAVADAYAAAATKLGLSIHTAPFVASNHALFEAVDEAHAAAALAALDREGLDHRYWYNGGLHHEPYFSQVSRDSLPQVERLAPRLLGLPTAPDLTARQIERVASALPRP